MQTTSNSIPTDLPDAVADPRPLLARAVAVAAPVIGRVRPDQLEGPTPCDELDVRGLLGHLTGALRRVGVIGQGLDIYAHPAATPGVPDDGWAAVWSATAAEVERIWRDDTLLTRTYRLPWATLPGTAVLASYTAEVTLHTWDVATATSQRVAWDDEVVSFALETMHRSLPAEGRAARYAEVAASLPAGVPPMSDPFAEAIDVGREASPLDQLVAWSGRHPHAS